MERNRKLLEEIAAGDKKKVAVSACLWGENCKYSGGNNLCQLLKDFLSGCEILLVCPEVLGGLPIPRHPAEIVDGVVTNCRGQSVDLEFRRGAELAFEACKRKDVSLAVLQSRSPSCGVKQVYDGSFSGKKIAGKGIFAGRLWEEKIPAIDLEEVLAFLQEVENKKS